MALKQCPACGSPLADNARFCGQCGRKVMAEVPPVPPHGNNVQAPTARPAAEVRQTPPPSVQRHMSRQADPLPEPVRVEPDYQAPDNGSETTILHAGGVRSVRPGVRRQQPVKNSNNLWIGIGIGIIVLLLVAGTVLYFLNRNQSKTYDYSDGQNPEVEQEFNYDNGEKDVHVREVSVPSAVPVRGAVTLDGAISDFPFTMDLYVADDGAVSGRYWNVLYDISLPVVGQMDRNGNINTTLGNGSSQSTLNLIAEGDNRYGGTWGRNNNIIVAGLREGKRPSAPRVSGDALRLRIKGNGMNKIARLNDNYFYYEDQGSSSGHWLRVDNVDYNTWSISSPNGAHLAYIELSDDATSGIMTDISGKTFDVTAE